MLTYILQFRTDRVHGVNLQHSGQTPRSTPTLLLARLMGFELPISLLVKAQLVRHTFVFGDKIATARSLQIPAANPCLYGCRRGIGIHVRGEGGAHRHIALNTVLLPMAQGDTDHTTTSGGLIFRPCNRNYFYAANIIGTQRVEVTH